MRFSTSPERRAILKGYLGYRAQLHRIGFANGFQWIDGSFLENVETIECRVPQDIDIVSFVHTPGGLNLTEEDVQLFDPAVTKPRFHVDAYVIEMNQVTPRELASWSAYWYSVWSHRRTHVWKGFLQVELAPIEDAEALAWLVQFDVTGDL